jgi:hypothetical protein
MKLVQFNKICVDLYEQYKAEPYELFLTGSSWIELTNELLGRVDSSAYEASISVSSKPVGAQIVQIVNPTTGGLVDIRLSESGHDSTVVELHIPTA